MLLLNVTCMANSVRLRRKKTAAPRKEGGFAVLELVVSLGILALLLALTVVAGQAFISHAALRATSVRMVEDLRFAQQSALASGHDWTVALSRYTPDYAIYDGGTMMSRVGFANGVHYHDGYLRMSSGTVRYGTLGNAQISGTIYLDDGGQQLQIKLYMGSGLQSLGVGS